MAVRELARGDLRLAFAVVGDDLGDPLLPLGLGAGAEAVGEFGLRLREFALLFGEISGCVGDGRLRGFLLGFDGLAVQRVRAAEGAEVDGAVGQRRERRDLGAVGEGDARPARGGLAGNDGRLAGQRDVGALAQRPAERGVGDARRRVIVNQRGRVTVE